MTTTYTDPEKFHTEAACREADTETLLRAWSTAQEVWGRCGGHKLAARMSHVMDTVEAELHDRDLPTPNRYHVN